MNVPRSCSLSFAIAVATIFAMLPATSLAQSTDYLLANSTDYRFQANSFYTFTPGLDGPPQLVDISGGTFTFTEGEVMPFAFISNVIFDLSPNTGIDDDAIDLLESHLFAVQNPLQNPTVYSDVCTLVPPFPGNPDLSCGSSLLLTFDNVSGAFTLSGGTGTTILPSIQFSATAVAVPEPTGFSVCLLLGVLLIGGRRRVTAGLTQLPSF